MKAFADFILFQQPRYDAMILESIKPQDVWIRTFIEGEIPWWGQFPRGGIIQFYSPYDKDEYTRELTREGRTHLPEYPDLNHKWSEPLNIKRKHAKRLFAFQPNLTRK